MKCPKEVHTIDFFAQKIWPNENLVGKTWERVFWTLFLSSPSPNLKLVSCRKIWFSLYVIWCLWLSSTVVGIKDLTHRCPRVQVPQNHLPSTLSSHQLSNPYHRRPSLSFTHSGGSGGSSSSTQNNGDTSTSTLIRILTPTLWMFGFTIQTAAAQKSKVYCYHQLCLRY